jgi:hypothetical protein
MGLGLVESLEQGEHIPLVGFLGGCEARLVHAVVDFVVGPLVGLFDLRLQSLREEDYLSVLFVNDIVKLNSSR